MDRTALLARGATSTSATGLIDIPNQADPATFDILTLKLGMTLKKPPPRSQPAFRVSNRHIHRPAMLNSPPAKSTRLSRSTVPRDSKRSLVYRVLPVQSKSARTALFNQLPGSHAHRSRPPAVPRFHTDEVRPALPRSESRLCPLVQQSVSLGSGPLACAPDVPALQLKGSELILSDSGPYHREKAAWNAQTTGAPPI